MVSVISEWGQSCHGNLDTAMRQARAAKDAGCAYAKWQTFEAERLVSRTAGRYWLPSLGGSATQLETFQANGMLKPADWKILGDYCHSIGVGFMSSPFDLEAVDLLVDAGVNALKLASGEITHRQLIERVAETGLPVVLSTGAADENEIEQALAWLGDRSVTLLACTLAYPTADEDAQLGRIETLSGLFPECPLGYSDHTMRVDTALAAAVLGATMLEKHCTLNTLGGVPDDRMALAAGPLAAYVRYAELGAAMRGSGALGATDAEQAARVGARRSLHAATNIPAGKTLQVDDFVCLRPGGPFNPADMAVLIGKTAAVDIPAGKQIESYDVRF